LEEVQGKLQQVSKTIELNYPAFYFKRKENNEVLFHLRFIVDFYLGKTQIKARRLR